MNNNKFRETAIGKILAIMETTNFIISNVSRLREDEKAYDIAKESGVDVVLTNLDNIKKFVSETQALYPPQVYNILGENIIGMFDSYQKISQKNGDIADNLNSLKDYQERFSKALEDSLEEILENGLKDNENTLADIEQLLKISNSAYQLSSEQKDKISKAVASLKQKNKENMETEQATMEDEKGKNESADEQPTANETSSEGNDGTTAEDVEDEILDDLDEDVELSPIDRVLKALNIEQELADKLREIDTTLQDYGNAVEAIVRNHYLKTVEDKIAELKPRYEDSDLSFAETVEYYSLLEQQQELNNPKNPTINRIVANMNGAKMDMNYLKATANKDKVIEERNDLDSKLFRFISCKKEGHLNKKIEKLNNKILKFKGNQLEAELLSFDKINQSMIKKANRHATMKAIGDGLKNAYDNTVDAIKDGITELGNIRSDISKRFKSKGNNTEDLKNKKGSMNGKPAFAEQIEKLWQELMNKGKKEESPVL